MQTKRKSIPKSDSKDKMLLRQMKERKAICLSKLKKLSDRIAILEAYQKQPSSKRLDLKTYLKRKGLNYNDFFTPMGYYSGASKVVSNDDENTALVYCKGMILNPRAGYHTPKRSIVTNDDHNKVVKSQLGMTWNPKINLYVPTTTYDSYSYAVSEENGDSGMDIMGGLRMKDIGSLNLRTKDAEVFTGFVKSLYEEEFDNVSEEFDLIEGSEELLMDKMGYSYAEGDEAEESLSKKEQRKKKRADKKDDRKQDREDRKKTREEFKEGKKDCKEKYQAGELSKDQYRECLKGERKEKKEKLTEQGGTVLARLVRAQSFVNPLSYMAKAGVLTLTDWNAFAFATRLAPAVLPEEEAKQKFTPEAIQKSKEGWKKVKKAWFGLGGDEKKLAGVIIKGYRKRPYKVSKKSKFEGDEYSFVAGGDDAVAIATAVTTGLGTLAGLIASLNKSGAPKNPYQKGQEPEGYSDALNELGDDPQQDPNSPKLDPNTGKWVDPTNGREIDPTTGKYTDTIFGLNKWVAIALGVGVLAGIYYYTKNKK